MASLMIPEEGKYRVRVAWDNPHDDGISSYTVTRSDGQTFESNGQPTTYTDDSTEPGRSYGYTVTAKSAAGDSPASRTATVILPEAPAAVTGLSASIRPAEAVHTSVQVTLTWNPPPEPQVQACEDSYPITEYRISRSAGGGPPVEIAVTPAGASLSHVDETADFNTNYTYHAEAVSRIGRGAASTTAVETPQRPIPPPTGLDVDEAATPDPFDGTVTIDWTSPQEGPTITGYRITRQDPGAQPRELVENTGSTDTAHTDSGLSAGETYIYTVAALSADHASPESEPLSVWAPLPVLNPAAQADTDHIDVSWTAPEETGSYGYIIRRREADGTDWAILNVVDSLHYTDGADPQNPFAAPPAHDTPYVYSIQPRNELGIGGAWAETGTVILMTRPGAPEGVTAGFVNDSIRIGWTRPTGRYLDGYRISRMTPAPDALTQGEWTTIQDSLAADITSHTDTDAAPTIRHSYRVQAYNAAGDGPWSETATITPITPPATPDDLTARVAGNDIAVSWTRPDSVHLNGYELSVARDDQPGQDPTVENIAASETQYRVADAPADVTFSFRLRSQNVAGNGPWTETATATRIAAPAAPTALTAEAGGTDIVVSWQPSPSRFVEGYHAAYEVAGSGQRHTANLEPSATSFTHTGSAEGETYEYRVRAHNPAGNGPWSETVQAARILAPQPPSGVTATVSGNDVRVSWTAPSAGIIDSYEVRYGVVGQTDTETASVEVPTTGFVHGNPQGDTAYEYRVRSVNARGSSEWSEAATAMRVIPPPPPTGLTAAAEQSDIILSWTAPQSGTVDHYQLERRQQGQTPWSANTVPAGTTSYAHTGAPSATVHEYRVRTVNTGGHSDWTDIVTGIWYEGVQPPVRISVYTAGEFLLVQWPASTTAGVTSYKFRSRIDGSSWTEATPQRLSHVMEWSRQQSLHEYQVRALIDDTPGQWSAIRRVVITTPGVVPNVRVNRESANGTRVHWDPPASGTPYRFIIEYRTNDWGWQTAGGASGLKTTYRVKGQAPDHQYQYRVRAMNDVGIRGPAGPANAPVDIPAKLHQWPHVPGNLAIQMVNSNTVQLHWNAPTERGSKVTSYRIYRKPVSDSLRLGDDFGHVLVPQTGNTRRVYTDVTAQPGVLYEYGVAAYRDGYPNPMSPISHPAYAQPW